MPELKAVILVAGQGTRLRPLTNKMPKCLVEVNGKPILFNALECLEKNNITEAILVVGYLKDKIKQKIGAKFGRMKIIYVDNDDYEKTNNSYSLWLAVKNLNNGLLLLEGDIFFENKLLQEFLADERDNLTIVEKYNPNLDGTFVEVGDNEKVLSWVHKKDRPEGFVLKGKHKTVNIHKFSANFIKQWIMPFLAKEVKEAIGKEPIESVFREIIENKGDIRVFDARGMKWFEIDDEADLKKAEEIFKNEQVPREREKMSKLDRVKNQHGGYWRYNFLDFYYLSNNHFPGKKFYTMIGEELPKLIPNYPSSQKTIAGFLSKWSKKKYFNEDNLIVGNGSSELIKILNEKIITKITVPVPTFNEWVKLPKEKISTFLLKEENKFELNPDELISAVKKTKSDFVVVNNPNNPTGNITNGQDIERILKTGVITIIDEAFVDFCKEYSVEDLVPRYDNLVIVKSLTKTMGLGGLRIGYLLTRNKKIKEEIRKYLPIWNVNSVAERFIELFPAHKKDFCESIKKTIKDRDFLFEELKKISYLSPYEPHANFIFCKTRISSRKIAEALFDEYNMLIKYGLNQKELESDSYIRIGVRAKKDNEKLISALRKIK